MIYTNTNEYNNYLITNSIKPSLKNYIIQVFKIYKKDLNIRRMIYYIELDSKNSDFCIHHNKLREFGIILNTRPNNILYFLKIYGMIEYRDYIQKETPWGRVCKRKEYKLTSKAFKQCLLMSEKTMKYCIILNDCIYNHQELHLV